MKIVIASISRAHLLDCARELQKRGHDVTFFSITPPKNLKRYGMTNGGKSLLLYIFPFYLLQHIFPSDATRRIYSFMLDCFVYVCMPPCDVFIAQSPNYQMSILRAKRKYKALTILDRGSSHVRTFNRLRKEYSLPPQDESYQRRDEREYNTVDYVAIASDFVYNTFVENKFPKERLFINPYGVSLQHFSSTVCTNEFDCIVVGSWSRRKGSHLIVEAFQNSSVKVLHVGTVCDVPFPKQDNFVHMDSIPETELMSCYKRAKVFLFPSYEDGFGLVLCQAAICGLPIVCSKNTGGPTLKRLINDDRYIYIMNNLTAVELKKGVDYALNLTARTENSLRNYVHDKMKEFTWDAYGERYNEFLTKVKKDVL